MEKQVSMSSLVGYDSGSEHDSQDDKKLCASPGLSIVAYDEDSDNVENELTPKNAVEESNQSNNQEEEAKFERNSEIDTSDSKEGDENRENVQSQELGPQFNPNTYNDLPEIPDSPSPNDACFPCWSIKSTTEPLLPPLPPAYCSESLQLKLESFMEMILKGHNFTESLKQKKDFGNPNILEKVVSSLHVNEYGSEYSKHLFDPEGYSKEEFITSLVQKSREIEGEHKPEKAEETVKPSDHKEPAKKKSKWDNQIESSNASSNASIALQVANSLHKLAKAKEVVGTITNNLSQERSDTAYSLYVEAKRREVEEMIKKK